MGRNEAVEMDWISLGWRDAILLLVALAAVYLVFMLLKLTRLGHQVRSPSTTLVEDDVQEPSVGRVSPLRGQAEAMMSEASVTERLENAHDVVPPLAARASTPVRTSEAWEEIGPLTDDAEVAEALPAIDASATRRTGGFGEHLAEHLARTDMELEVQRMRSEMERMRSEMEELRAARRVSPQYAEAMEMAQRGMSAQDLADRLGISLGEAELVCALSRSDQNFDEGEDHGAEQFAAGADGFEEFNRRRQSGG